MALKSSVPQFWLLPCLPTPTGQTLLDPCPLHTLQGPLSVLHGGGVGGTTSELTPAAKLTNTPPSQSRDEDAEGPKSRRAFV